MPTDMTPAGATPAAVGATPTQTPSQEQERPAGQEPATGNGRSGDDPLGEPGKRALEAERAARRDAEDRFKAAQKELDDLKTASLSAEEKRSKRLAELEQEQSQWAIERQELVLRGEVASAAARLGFSDPGDALRLLDRTALNFAPDGSPQNLEAQLQGLAKAKPYLLANRSMVSFDTGLGAPGSSGKRSYTRQELRDPKFYQEHEADIQIALREGRITG